MRVEGAPPGKPAASAAALPAAEVTSSFAGAAAVDSALRNSPDTRPESVARAQGLINDPAYPGPGVLKQVSQLLADKLGNSSE